MKKTRTSGVPTPLTIRVDPQLKADLETLARSNNRSLANYVQTLLKDHRDKRAKKKQTEDKASV